MPEMSPERRRKGTIGGLIFIVLGILSAPIIYVLDSSSFDYIRMDNAVTFAVLHAVLWCVAGLLVILWYNRDPNQRGGNFQDDNNRQGP